MPARGPLTDHERYRFDLHGYLVRRDVLSSREVRALRAAVAGLSLPTPGTTIQSQRFRDHLGRHQAFRDLMDHAGIIDVLVDLCGPFVRLDHAYGIVMVSGTSGLALHGGGTPHDPAQYYRVVDGRMVNGLVAVQWALVDHRPGDGGFCCIPGSHKASFARPEPGETDLVVEVPMRAGDLVVFTEALTHGTLPWRGVEDRLTLLYKYSPGHLSWGREWETYPPLVPMLTPRQRRLVQPPSVYPHDVVG